MFDYQCDNCSDGQEALEAVKDRIKSQKPMYKLLMIDYSMPILDGPNATMAIRDLFSKYGITREH